MQDKKCTLRLLACSDTSQLPQSPPEGQRRMCSPASWGRSAMASLAVSARGSPRMPANVTAMLVHRPPSTLSSAETWPWQ